MRGARGISGTSRSLLGPYPILCWCCRCWSWRAGGRKRSRSTGPVDPGWRRTACSSTVSAPALCTAIHACFHLRLLTLIRCVVAARARRPRAGAALHPAVRHRGRRGHSSYRVEMEGERLFGFPFESSSSPSSILTAKHSTTAAWWMIAPHIYGRSRTFSPFMYV